MDVDSEMNQDTPDINFSEDANEADTPDINFTELLENERLEANFLENTEEEDEKDEEAVNNGEQFDANVSDIDDLDEPDQYVEGDDIEAHKPHKPDDDIENDKTDEQRKTVDKPKESQGHRFLSLPSARVKHIMKADPDVTLITAECTFLVAKATELFIESLAREAFTHTAQSKKKTVQKRDVDAAIENIDALMFLEGMMNG